MEVCNAKKRRRRVLVQGNDDHDIKEEAREMVEGLADLPEVLDFILSTGRFPTVCNSNARKSFSLSWFKHGLGAQTHIQAKHAYTQTKI